MSLLVTLSIMHMGWWSTSICATSVLPFNSKHHFEKYGYGYDESSKLAFKSKPELMHILGFILFYYKLIYRAFSSNIKSERFKLKYHTCGLGTSWKKPTTFNKNSGLFAMFCIHQNPHLYSISVFSKTLLHATNVKSVWNDF